MDKIVGCSEAAATIRAELDNIIVRWVEAVRKDEEVSQSEKQPDLVLIDHMPGLLEEIARRLDSVAKPGSVVSLGSVGSNQTNLHAYARFQEGYKLGEVLKELSHLRSSLLHLFSEHEMALETAAQVTLHSLMDATTAKAVNDMVRWEHRLLESVIMQSEEGITVADSGGRFLVFNPEAEALLGQGQRDVAPEDWAKAYALYDQEGELLTPDEIPLRRALQGDVVLDRWLQVRLPDGTMRWLEASAWPIRDKNETVVGGVALFRDRTERREVEAYRAQTERFRDQFLGILGHDLRTPLTAIRMSTNLLMRQQHLEGESFKASTLRALPRIESSTERILRMIDDLLDFTRGRLGSGIPIERSDADLAELYRNVAQELAATDPNRQVNFKVNGDVTGCWDPDRLMQVLNNLIGNAFNHSPPDTPITVTLSDEGEQVQLCVNNQGPPISPEDQPHVFAPFRRGADVPGEGDGIGLGLYIVRTLVRAHGGSITLESDAESGTTFRVTLPKRPGLNEEASAVAPETGSRPPHHAHDKHAERGHDEPGKRGAGGRGHKDHPPPETSE